MIEWHDKEVLEKIGNIVEVASKNVAEKVAARALRNVKKRTGALGRSIEVSASKYKEGGYIVSAYGSPDKFYASFVELGTFKDAAQPFLRPALKSPQTQRDFTRELEGALK